MPQRSRITNNKQQQHLSTLRSPTRRCASFDGCLERTTMTMTARKLPKQDSNSRFLSDSNYSSNSKSQKDSIPNLPRRDTIPNLPRRYRSIVNDDDVVTSDNKGHSDNYNNTADLENDRVHLQQKEVDKEVASKHDEEADNDDDLSEVTNPSVFNVGDVVDEDRDDAHDDDNNSNDEIMNLLAGGHNNINQNEEGCEETITASQVSSNASLISSSFDDDADIDIDNVQQPGEQGQKQQQCDDVPPPVQTISSPPPAAATGQTPSSSAFLTNIAIQFRKGVKVGTHSYHFKKYDNTFVGNEAVTYMVENGMAKTREDAVFLGQRLIQDLQLFYHVCWDHGFKDGYYFYKYTRDVSDEMDTYKSTTTRSISDKNASPEATAPRATTTSHVLPLTTHNAISTKKSMETDSLPDDGSFFGYSSATTCHTTTTLRDMNEISKLFQRNVTVGTHIYHFKRYKETFVGREAVDYMVKSKLAKSRKDAVFLGQRLLDMNLFRHVCGHHNFKDAYLFYCYTDTTTTTADDSSQEREDEDGGENHPTFQPAATRSALKRTSQSTDSESKSRHKRNVSFDSIQERLYERILEVHPSTSSGPSVGLGWRFIDKPPVDFGRYWGDTTANGRSRSFILSSQCRKEILLDLGYTKRQLIQATKLNEKIRKQRKATLNNFTARTMADNDDKCRRRRRSSSSSKRSKVSRRLFRTQ